MATLLIAGERSILSSSWCDAHNLPRRLDKQQFFYNIHDRETLLRCQSGRSSGNGSEYYIGLSNDNIFDFTSESVKDSCVIFWLTENLTSLEAKIHAYNLLHQAIAGNKYVWLNGFYTSLIDFLIGKESTLPSPMRYGLFQARKSQLRFLRVFIDSKLQLSERRLVKSFESDLVKWKSSSQDRRILITGWYGTETAGDKAILMEVISFYQSKYGKVQFGITSINEGLSYLTNEEFNIQAEVFKLNELKASKVKLYDTILFGGGPLMDSSQLKFIEPLFRWAHRTGRRTIIFGCGYGPVKTDLGKSKVKSILQNSSAGFFRDELSLQNAKMNGWDKGDYFACDPALNYVNRIKSSLSVDVRKNDNILYAMLRKQTAEYAVLSEESLIKISHSILGFFQLLFERNAWHTELIPMHIFWYGNDDRDYFLTLKNMLSATDFFNFDNRPILLNDIIAKLEVAKFGLPMRFHAHLFLIALGIPFLSIDYTGSGGKIDALLRRYELSEYSIALSDVSSDEELYSRFTQIMKEYEIIRLKIRDGVDRDIFKLKNLYESLDL